jgi:hypothetical protein
MRVSIEEGRKGREDAYLHSSILRHANSPLRSKSSLESKRVEILTCYSYTQVTVEEEVSIDDDEGRRRCLP